MTTNTILAKAPTRALVTGGEGFIGSHVVERLLEDGYEVTVLDDRSTGRFENIQHLVAKYKMYRALCDIRNPFDVLDFFRIAKPEIVFHLAAQASITTSLADPILDMQINGLGTLNVIRAAEAVGVRRIVFASTSAVYPSDATICMEQGYTKPESPYGVSKVAAENYLALFGNATILRLGNVYGPRQMPVGENQVIARMLRHLKSHTEFLVHGDGKQERDFVYVKDVAEAFARAVDEHGFTIYNIASGSQHSVNTVADLVGGLWKKNSHTIWPHDDQQDSRRSVNLSVEAAQNKLNWHAKTSLIEGLRETVKWWKEMK